jgi:diaminohydroxyphosphoribosylaminopyrimidine deaminase/5-amino-6-(5-phosphoribosylamino)uracil reductase
MPTDARMLSLPGATLIATCNPNRTDIVRMTSAGAEVQVLPAAADGRVDLPELIRYLGSREQNEVLIEAGPTLAGAAVAAGIVDEIVLYLAPHLMGDGARGLFRLPGLTRMADRIALTIQDLRQVGPDLRVTVRPVGR